MRRFWCLDETCGCVASLFRLNLYRALCNKNYMLVVNWAVTWRTFTPFRLSSVKLGALSDRTWLAAMWLDFWSWACVGVFLRAESIPWILLAPASWFYSNTVELDDEMILFYSGVEPTRSAQAGVGTLVRPQLAGCVDEDRCACLDLKLISVFDTTGIRPKLICTVPGFRGGN